MSDEPNGPGEAGNGREQQRSQRPPFPDAVGKRPTLADFRRRVDAFWSDARTTDLRQGLRATRQEEAVAPARAFQNQLGDSLAVLEASIPDAAEFRLQKSLTLRDGQIVSMTGGAEPLPEDDRLLVVTSTTSVMASDSFAAETNVLMFERESRE